MTAEELAEIRKRCQEIEAYIAAGNWTAASRCWHSMRYDRLALLTHTAAQAQRIAELEAQLEEVKSARDMNFDTCARLEAQLAASGALATAQAERLPAGTHMSRQKTAEDYERINATAQAVTLTEDDRLLLNTVRTSLVNGQEEFSPWAVRELVAIIDRLTGASTP